MIIPVFPDDNMGSGAGKDKVEGITWSWHLAATVELKSIMKMGSAGCYQKPWRCTELKTETKNQDYPT